MNDYEKQRKREYHRKWRAEHRESVRASQQRYWLKKAAEQAQQTQTDQKGECES